VIFLPAARRLVWNGQRRAAEVRQELSALLADYGRIPIAFEVDEIYEAVCDTGGRFRLVTNRVADAYLKDYDAVSDPPADWPLRNDISNWAFFSAVVQGRRVGGATVAWRTPNLEMLDGRADLAVLWDIRVAVSHRRRGIGSALFRAAAAWARERGCCQLKVETQNINAAACRFYARHGCVLLAANRGVYPGLPNEVQLLWYKDLAQAEPNAG
jgi:GNAT superfamily N-acetyltransferase